MVYRFSLSFCRTRGRTSAMLRTQRELSTQAPLSPCGVRETNICFFTCNVNVDMRAVLVILKHNLPPYKHNTLWPLFLNFICNSSVPVTWWLVCQHIVSDIFTPLNMSPPQNVDWLVTCQSYGLLGGLDQKKRQ